MPSTRCSTVSAGYIRSSHLRCRWTNDMERVRKQFAWAWHANWLQCFRHIYWRRFFLNSNRRIGRFRGVIFATMRYINWHRHLPLHYVYILHSIFFIATKSVSIIFEYVQSSCMRKIFKNGSMLIVMPIYEQIVASTNFITAIIMFS